jgi:hypothetical protein
MTSSRYTRRALSSRLADRAAQLGVRLEADSFPDGRIGYRIDGGPRMTPGETADQLRLSFEPSDLSTESEGTA